MSGKEGHERGLAAERLYEQVMRREGFGIHKTNVEDDRAYGFDFWLWDSNNPGAQLLIDLTLLRDPRDLERKRKNTYRQVVQLRFNDLQDAANGHTAATIAVLAGTARALAGSQSSPPGRLNTDDLSEQQLEELRKLAQLRLQRVLPAGNTDLLEQSFVTLQKNLYRSGLGVGTLANATGRSRKHVQGVLRKLRATAQNP